MPEAPIPTSPDRMYVAKNSAGPGYADHTDGPDMKRLRAYRMGRLQAELQQRDLGGAVLYDPINIRYATGSRNMAVWTLHNPARYAFVPAEGKAVMFDFHNCEHLSDGLETIGEVRPARSWFFFSSGSRLAEKAQRWANEIIDLVGERCGGNKRIAFDRLDPLGAKALEAGGIEIHEGQEPCEIARSIKSADELACMNHAIAVCEAGMARMQAAVWPGVTENDLFAMLSDTNMRMGGEWMECRLLSSGGRTNPWFQEASDRVVRGRRSGEFRYRHDRADGLLRRHLAHLSLRPRPGDGQAARAVRAGDGADPFQSGAGPARNHARQNSRKRPGRSRRSIWPTGIPRCCTGSGCATSGRRWCTSRTSRSPAMRGCSRKA